MSQSTTSLINRKNVKHLMDKVPLSLIAEDQRFMLLFQLFEYIKSLHNELEDLRTDLNGEREARLAPINKQLGAKR